MITQERGVVLTPELVTLKLSEIVFDEEIYPRNGHDHLTVQRYAEDMEAIEARSAFISVSAQNKILDGKHRWLAYRKIYEGQEVPDIQVFRYDVTGWLEEIRLAIDLNEHGLALSSEDKEMDAKRFYRYGITSYDDIAAWLHVGKSKISAWLARTVKEERESRNKKIKALWLACETQTAIAEACDCTHPTVSNEVDHFVKTVLENQNYKARASHATDFEPPLYNIWSGRVKTAGPNHFGNSESRWLDNLLYLYTEPFDIVVDPFAGGGSTIDVCKKRYRRYWASDRKPIIERETEIRKHDLVGPAPEFPIALPPLPHWHDVKLVYLDPPYWKQAEGQYSDDPTDLGNMGLDDFTKTLGRLIVQFGRKLQAGAVIAMLMQPTQWKAPGHQYTDHIADILRTVKLPLDMRFSVPYQPQQYTAQHVEWAKANKQCLVLTRELIVWHAA